MASVEECRSALDKLAASMSGADDKTRRAMVDRTVSCEITDLDVTFTGRLDGGTLVDIEDDRGSVPPPPERAQIRLSMTGDDLLALTNGEVSFAHAWLTGRVKIDASFRDLLRLRSLM